VSRRSTVHTRASGVRYARRRGHRPHHYRRRERRVSFSCSHAGSRRQTSVAARVLSRTVGTYTTSVLSTSPSNRVHKPYDGGTVCLTGLGDRPYIIVFPVRKLARRPTHARTPVRRYVQQVQRLLSAETASA